MDLKADYDQQSYLMFDLGHNEVKVGQFSKNVNKNFDYFALPTHLFPYLNKGELYKK